jgi:hypothetical protein
MEFGSLSFVGLSLTAVALLRLLQSRTQREVALLAVNTIFLASFVDVASELISRDLLSCFWLFGDLRRCMARPLARHLDCRGCWDVHLA